MIELYLKFIFLLCVLFAKIIDEHVGHSHTNDHSSLPTGNSFSRSSLLQPTTQIAYSEEQFIAPSSYPASARKDDKNVSENGPTIHDGPNAPSTTTSQSAIEFAQTVIHRMQGAVNACSSKNSESRLSSKSHTPSKKKATNVIAAEKHVATHRPDCCLHNSSVLASTRHEASSTVGA